MRGWPILLVLAAQVYTRRHENYYHGYLAENPNSPHVPRALWLKAFALRVNPPSESDETSPSMGELRPIDLPKSPRERDPRE